MEPVLEVSAVGMNFGGLRALNEVDLTVRSGEIVALIGPNGAGKTTFFNCVTSIYTPTEGDVWLTGRNGARTRVNGMKPNLVTALGMARTFQNIRLFRNMSVLENVMIARHCRTRVGILGALFRPPSVRREEREIMDRGTPAMSEARDRQVARCSPRRGPPAPATTPSRPRSARPLRLQGTSSETLREGRRSR